MQLYLNTNSLADYQTFLAVKQLPTYRIRGHVSEFPDEYANRLGIAPPAPPATLYTPLPSLFDYQRDITAKLAIPKRRYAVFADPGLGKTLIMFEYAKHVANTLPAGQCVLIVAPPMVVNQHCQELSRFYNESLPIRRIMASELRDWLTTGTERIGITNYECIRDGLVRGRLGALILDESSVLASHYGKWGQRLIELGRGLDWKLALTGTPAPNDPIEYGNHAVFLDQFPNVNAFLARFFVNRGQTQNRWELKPHAREAFYRSLSHWCIFLSNPATYGWQDNCGTIPPIHIHIEHVDLTPEQEALVRKKTGGLFAHKIGGIVSRGAMGQISKGHYKGQQIATNKPEFIQRLVNSWSDPSSGESTIIWCLYNEEQAKMAQAFPDAANISGNTPFWRRLELIEEFKAGVRKRLITKDKILGFGMNLQVATRHVFSGLQDSYLKFWQAVKRSNRIGSTMALNVHIPVTDVEMPMIETVLKKLHRVQEETAIQERLFKQEWLG